MSKEMNMYPNMTGVIQPQASVGNSAHCFSFPRFYTEPVHASCVFISMPWGAGQRGLEIFLGNRWLQKLPFQNFHRSEVFRSTLQD